MLGVFLSARRQDRLLFDVRNIASRTRAIKTRNDLRLPRLSSELHLQTLQSAFVSGLSARETDRNAACSIDDARRCRINDRLSPKLRASF